MTNINTNYSNGYYQLSGQQKTENTSTVSTTASTEVLKNAVSGTSAYLLDLSPEAQAYLSGQQTKQAGDDQSFNLTGQQIQQINSIIAKYKDEPFDQQTFNKIQNDLREAGLSAEQLAGKEQISTFNATALLIDALNGKDIMDSAEDKTTDLETKKQNYLDQIVTLWDSMRPEEDKDAGDSETDTISTAGA